MIGQSGSYATCYPIQFNSSVQDMCTATALHVQQSFISSSISSLKMKHIYSICKIYADQVILMNENNNIYYLFIYGIRQF